jgi:sporulation integral membrane protein YlbJ
MKITIMPFDKYIISGIAVTAMAISMIALPSLVLESAGRGLALWAGSVLPALLPFFICSDFMISLGIPGIISNYFERCFQKIFQLPGTSAFVFIISIVSGYPMGARIIGTMKRRGEVTDNEGIRMLSFCSNAGPLFILGTLGVGMLNSAEAGGVIAISHYGGALLNGILFRFLFRGEKRKDVTIYNKNYYVNKNNTKTIFEMLTDSILSSLKVLGIIGCFIVIFVYITDLLEALGALTCFKTDYSQGFFKGIIEMTVGLSQVSASAFLGLRLKSTLAAFLISFGGICVLAQSLSVLKGLKISLWTYLKIKLAHGFISATITYFLYPYFMNKAVLSVGLFENYESTYHPGFFMELLFSTRMIIIILILFILTVIINYFISRGKEPDH